MGSRALDLGPVTGRGVAWGEDRPARLDCPPPASLLMVIRLGRTSAHASRTTIERSSETGLPPEAGSNVSNALTETTCPFLRSSALSVALVGLTVRTGADARVIFIAPVAKTLTPAAVTPRLPLKVTRQVSVPGPLHDALSLIAALPCSTLGWPTSLKLVAVRRTLVRAGVDTPAVAGGGTMLVGAGVEPPAVVGAAGTLVGASVGTGAAWTMNDSCASSPSPAELSCGLTSIVQVPAPMKCTAEGASVTPLITSVRDELDPRTILQTVGVAIENDTGHPKEERTVGL